MAPKTLRFGAVLFDMDGTLVDSTAGVVGAWETFVESYPGIDVKKILSTSHGVRTVENLRVHCGLEDPEELEREAVRFEEAIVESSAKNGRQGIVTLPGVKEIMSDIGEGCRFPNPRWAICTSGTRKYATSALTVANIPIPDIFVTAEDVKQGKPKPDPYLLGAEKCNISPKNCLVIEDAPNGIRSGKAAGSKVLGLITSHSKEEIVACKPDFLVQDLSSVSMKLLEDGIEVTIHREVNRH